MTWMARPSRPCDAQWAYGDSHHCPGHGCQDQPRRFYPLVVVSVSLVVSTVYLCYYYVIDVIAGVLLAVLCLGVMFWLYREHGEPYTALWLPTHSSKWSGERRA